jgi:hypothetical protein
MNPRFASSIALAALFALPVAASAADLGYTYAEMRYLDVDLGNGNQADGGTAIGWYRFSEHAFAIGQYATTESERGATASTIALGAGAILPLNAQWDAVAIGTLRETQRETPAGDVDSGGYGAQLGVRGMPIPKLETRLFVNYVDVVDDDTSVFVSGDYWLSPSLAAGVAAEFGGNADTFSLGVRYSFGR